MSLQTLDPATRSAEPPAPTPPAPDEDGSGGGRGPIVAFVVAALVGAALAAGITWLVVATVTLDITPVAVGM